MIKQKTCISLSRYLVDETGYPIPGEYTIVQKKYKNLACAMASIKMFFRQLQKVYRGRELELVDNEKYKFISLDGIKRYKFSWIEVDI